MVKQEMHVIKSAEAEVWKGTNVCLMPQSNWDCIHTYDHPCYNNMLGIKLKTHRPVLVL
jgi:hypothetical protein